MDEPIWTPPSNVEPAADGPTAPGSTDQTRWSTPSEHPRRAIFVGRTPGRSSALRAGLALGGFLVIAVGAAAVLAASPQSAPSNGAGAAPSAANGQPGPDDGNGRGPGWKRVFGFGGPEGPGAFGPFGGPGPGLGFGRGGLNRLADRMGIGGATVTNVSGSAISLKTDDGWTRTITITATTTITKGGQPATAADIKVGDNVRFTEERNADGSFSITSLAIVLPETAGTVTAVGSDTITITRRDGTSATIRTNGSTTYRLGDAAGSRSDVKVGSLIAAVGQRGSDGEITATTVQIVLPRVLGTVTSVATDSLRLRRPDGTTVTVHVGSDTSIRIAGAGSSKLSDLKVGMIAGVEGSQRSDGSIDASAIRAGQPGRLRPGQPMTPPAPGAASSPSTSNG